jgi:hypothetical protein
VILLGVDPHKSTHTATAVDPVTDRTPSPDRSTRSAEGTVTLADR